MKYRMMGKTGLRVSEIGFGCGNVGGLMIRAPLEERLSAVKRAIALGINYFDTAAQYGDGQSETNLGEVLSLIKADVKVATKVRIAREDFNDIKGAIHRSLETSLRRLRRDSVDILQLHSQVSLGASQNISVDQVLGKNGVADAFDSLRSQGLVRFIGFTGLGDTEALHRIVESDRFDVIQVYFNLLNPSAAFAMPAGFKSQDFRGLMIKASHHNMAVAAVRVMAGGALGGAAARSGYAARTAGDLVPGSDYEADERRARQLDFLIGGNISSLSQAGVLFALSQADVSTVLVGFSNNEQIESAAACSGQENFSESAIERLKKLWATNFEA